MRRPQLSVSRSLAHTTIEKALRKMGVGLGVIGTLRAPDDGGNTASELVAFFREHVASKYHELHPPTLAEQAAAAPHAPRRTPSPRLETRRVPGRASPVQRASPSSPCPSDPASERPHGARDSPLGPWRLGRWRRRPSHRASAAAALASTLAPGSSGEMRASMASSFGEMLGRCVPRFPPRGAHTSPSPSLSFSTGPSLPTSLGAPVRPRPCQRPPPRPQPRPPHGRLLRRRVLASEVLSDTMYLVVEAYDAGRSVREREREGSKPLPSAQLSSQLRAFAAEMLRSLVRVRCIGAGARRTCSSSPRRATPLHLSCSSAASKGASSLTATPRAPLSRKSSFRPRLCSASPRSARTSSTSCVLRHTRLAPPSQSSSYAHSERLLSTLWLDAPAHARSNARAVPVCRFVAGVAVADLLVLCDDWQPPTVWSRPPSPEVTRPLAAPAAETESTDEVLVPSLFGAAADLWRGTALATSPSPEVGARKPRPARPRPACGGCMPSCLRCDGALCCWQWLCEGWTTVVAAAGTVVAALWRQLLGLWQCCCASETSPTFEPEVFHVTPPDTLQAEPLAMPLAIPPMPWEAPRAAGGQPTVVGSSWGGFSIRDVRAQYQRYPPLSV